MSSRCVHGFMSVDPQSISKRVVENLKESIERRIKENHFSKLKEFERHEKRKENQEEALQCLPLPGLIIFVTGCMRKLEAAANCCDLSSIALVAHHVPASFKHESLK